MYKLIIFSALIACAFASWTPSNGHKTQHQGPHQSIASHDAAIGHSKHAATGISHGRVSTHGQLESVHHGGGTRFPNKEFRRTKKLQHNKRLEGSKGKNRLRRVHSRKHYRH